MVGFMTHVDTDDVEHLLGLTLNEHTGANVSTILERVVIEMTLASLHFSVVVSRGAARIEKNFVCAFSHGKYDPVEFEKSVKHLAEILLSELKTEAGKNN